MPAPVSAGNRCAPNDCAAGSRPNRLRWLTGSPLAAPTQTWPSGTGRSPGTVDGDSGAADRGQVVDDPGQRAGGQRRDDAAVAVADDGDVRLDVGACGPQPGQLAAEPFGTVLGALLEGHLRQVGRLVAQPGDGGHAGTGGQPTGG